MRLAADASVLIAEALRERGRRLIRDEQLPLIVTERVWSETHYELRRRAAILGRNSALTQQAAVQLLLEAAAALASRVRVADDQRFEKHLDDARRRVPRDPTDAPTVALALAADCGIWTTDYDFFGCGVAVWVSDTLRTHLAASKLAAGGGV